VPDKICKTLSSYVVRYFCRYVDDCLANNGKIKIDFISTVERLCQLSAITKRNLL